MTQANQTAVIWTTIIASLILLIAGGFAISSVNSNLALVGQSLSGLEMPTAASITALITIPEMPDVDNVKLDRVCELTEGCEYYEEDWTYNQVFNHFDSNDQEDAEEDFFEVMSELLDIDEDEFSLMGFDERDTQVRAYSDNDEEDGNWEVKVFAKVRYSDDGQDTEYVYVLITTTLDEEEYDSMTVEEVDRNFEFA